MKEYLSDNELLELLNTGHRLSVIYSGMVHRCTNPANTSYKRYGAVGIKVAKEWLTNRNEFLKWSIMNGYKENLTIDRIDGTKGYYPENCRWVTVKVQGQNVRTSSRNTSGFKGVTYRAEKNKWEASIQVDKKYNYLGTYKTAIEAAEAYDKYVVDNKLHHPTNKTLDNYPN